MTIRGWVKVRAAAWLQDGPIRELDLETKAIFVGLLAMACSKRFGHRGRVTFDHEFGLGDQLIARILGTSTRKWLKAKRRLVTIGLISVLPHSVIEIQDWPRYRSEYERQVDQRRARSAPAGQQSGLQADSENQSAEGWCQ